MQRENNRKIKQQNFQKLWDHFKKSNIGVMGIPEEKKRPAKEILEVIMAENVSKLKIPNDRSNKQVKFKKQHRHIIF